MNIKDLKPDSYTVLNQPQSGKLNIANLNPSDYSIVNSPQKQEVSMPLGGGKYAQSIVEEQEKGIGTIKSGIQKGIRDVQKGMETGGIAGVPSALKGLAESAFGATSGALQVGAAPITAAVTPIAKKTLPVGISILKNQFPVFAKIAEMASPKVQEELVPKFQELIQKNPDAAELTSNIFNTVLGVVGGDVNISGLAKGGLKSVTPSALKQTGGEILDASGNVIKGATSKMVSKFAPTPEIDVIQELISPKLTPTQTKLAQTEGRILKGEKPTFFKSGTPDTVLPSKKVVKAAETIKINIPGSSKMTESELFDALSSKTKEIANDLKPKMKATKIEQGTIEKINKDWEELKLKQVAEADATEEANVIKNQLQFEERLKNIDPNSFDDLWEARIKYDESVPTNVKNATEISDSRLQYKKDQWLQNRDILNKAINDAKFGLGDDSGKAFSDMSDMYNARQNILTKSKVDKTGGLSGIKELMKKYPRITTLLGVGSAYELAKKLGIDIIP